MHPQVDNVILRDPPMLRSPLFVGLDLTPLLQPQQQQPIPGGFFQPLTLQMSNSAEALLRAQGSAAEEDAPEKQECTKDVEQARKIDALQQLVAILEKDGEWIQV